MGEHENYVQVLVRTLQKQVETLSTILEITKEQSRIADAPDFDEVMLEDTLNRKEVLIARLNELDAGFTSVYGRVRKEIQARQDDYKEDIQQMQSLIKECTDLGVEIKVLESRNRDKLVQCFSKKQQQYGSQKTAASVASHYNQTMNNTKVVDSFFLDRKK